MAQRDYGKLITNVTRFLINYVVRFIFATITLYCSWMPLQDLRDWFSYHVIFCTIGLMPLIAEALMVFTNDELWSRQLSRTEKYGVHGALATTGTLLLIVGNLPGIYYIKPGFHLYTVHGITGLVSMIILTVSVFLGLSVNYSNKMKRIFSMKPIWYKFIHNLTGLYIPLMAEALMLFVGDELWSRQLTRKQKYGIHAILITVGTVFIIVGNSLVFHYISAGNHLDSVHGITGFVSMILLILSLFLGVAANSSNEMQKYLSLRPVWYKFIHNGVGILGYAIGIVSLCYGYYTHWFTFYYGEESRMAALVLTIAVTVWSLNGAIVSGYNQIKNLIS